MANNPKRARKPRTEAQKEARKAKYAAERAGRDKKYQALGYKSYNDYETKRRNKKAQEEGYKNYPQKVKVRKDLAKRVTDFYNEKLLNKGTIDQLFQEFEEDNEADFWSVFREVFKETP